MVSTGAIDTGGHAEVQDADPRFTICASKALLDAMNVRTDVKNISALESYDDQGGAARRIRVKVASHAINSLTGILRRFTWGEVMKVFFSRVHEATGRLVIESSRE